MDFGYPQNSETDTLKMYITTEGIKSEIAVVSLTMGMKLTSSVRILRKSRFKRRERRRGADQTSNTARTRHLLM